MPICWTPRPAAVRAYTCHCGVRWHVGPDGWIMVGRR